MPIRFSWLLTDDWGFPPTFFLRPYDFMTSVRWTMYYETKKLLTVTRHKRESGENLPSLQCPIHPRADCHYFVLTQASHTLSDRISSGTSTNKTPESSSRKAWNHHPLKFSIVIFLQIKQNNKSDSWKCLFSRHIYLPRSGSLHVRFL